ncbi:MAG TPA: sugar ABC transporter permease [Chloroflexota bacterium]|nr:sugar ABC transporter permease [Chloroflexota bacterium]
MATTIRSEGTDVRSPRSWRRGEELTGYLFILPSALLIAAFLAFPVIYSLWLSLVSWDGMSAHIRFVGLGNYDLLIHSSEFWNSLKVTGYYTFVTVPLRMAVALALAIFLNQKIRGLGIYRTLYFTPVVTSGIAVSIIWVWIYDPTWGIANWVLSLVGIPPLQWLSSPNEAMPGLILMSIWKSVGFDMVIYLAGLQGIPETYYEAARVDGAGLWSMFRHITWPLLAPTTFFILVTGIIGASQVFDQVFVMTNGGPLRSTEVLVFILYQHAFKFFEMGYASALAWVIFLIVLVFTVLQWKFLPQDVT